MKESEIGFKSNAFASSLLYSYLDISEVVKLSFRKWPKNEEL